MSGTPFHDRDGFIWMDGRLVDWRSANVHVLTHALHYASSVFEGERAYGGKIFKLREHTERLVRSAQILDMKIPYSVEEIEAATHAVIEADKIADGYIRPIVWRGSEGMGLAAHETKIHVAIATWAWPSYFAEEEIKRGLKLMISPWRRPSPDTFPTAAKTAGSYTIGLLSKHIAESKGFQDALLLDYRGQIAEATGENFFMLKDEKLHTPIPDAALDGITHRVVMELAKKRGIEVIERVIMPQELEGADEVFLTGTAAEVVPVGSIDAYVFPQRAVTLQLREDYLKLVRA